MIEGRFERTRLVASRYSRRVTAARPEPPAAAAPHVDAEPVEGSSPPICPFLMAEAGVWRLAVASRDHRCTAVSPPAVLAVEKQERLCLTERHPTCATYLASLAAREARLSPVGEHPTRWRLGRTTSVIEDRGGVVSLIVGLLLDRRRWPAIPALLLVATLLTLAISGFRPDLPASVVASPTPSATTPPTPSTPPTASPTATPTPTPSPSPTVAPSPTATVGPSPQPTHRTYRVRGGDTLTAIAARYGTTVRAIAELNGITDPSRLQVGQVLLIP